MNKPTFSSDARLDNHRRRPYAVALFALTLAAFVISFAFHVAYPTVFEFVLYVIFVASAIMAL